MDRKFTFVYLENKMYSFLNDRNVTSYIAKWSMKGNLRIQTYSFNEPFQIYKSKEFVLAFLNDSNVISTLLTSSGQLARKAADVEVEQLHCSVTSMSFFDQLINPSNGIIREGGSIRKCLDTQIGEFIVSDELRRMLFDRESENYELYSDGDRKQFLFALFMHLVLGGQWCQYEDNINAYLNTARTIYKELINVQRDSETKMIFVNTIVLQVIAKDEIGFPYFPKNKDNIQNFVYLIIDPSSQHVTVLSHDYEGEFCF